MESRGNVKTKYKRDIGYKIFYIPYKDEDINLSLNEEYTMSGNNVDGFILTLKTNKNK